MVVEVGNGGNGSLRLNWNLSLDDLLVLFVSNNVVVWCLVGLVFSGDDWSLRNVYLFRAADDNENLKRKTTMVSLGD